MIGKRLPPDYRGSAQTPAETLLSSWKAGLCTSVLVGRVNIKVHVQEQPLAIAPFQHGTPKPHLSNILLVSDPLSRVPCSSGQHLALSCQRRHAAWVRGAFGQLLVNSSLVLPEHKPIL